MGMAVAMIRWVRQKNAETSRTSEVQASSEVRRLMISEMPGRKMRTHVPSDETLAIRSQISLCGWDEGQNLPRIFYVEWSESGKNL